MEKNLSIHQQMNKENMVYMCHKIRASCKKDVNPAFCSNMDRPLGYYAKWNKLDRENTVCSHLYMESKNAKLIEMESRMVVSRGQEVGEIGKYWPKGKRLQL